MSAETLPAVTAENYYSLEINRAYTQSNTPVCSFRIAWSETYKETETKLFLSCTAWRGTGELVSKFFRKGQEILVEGRLATREWTDPEGNKRQTVELTVERIHFCGSRQERGDRAGDYSRPAQRPVDVSASDWAEGEDDGNLPF